MSVCTASQNSLDGPQVRQMGSPHKLPPRWRQPRERQTLASIPDFSVGIYYNNNNNNNNNNNRIPRRNEIFTISSLRHEQSPTRTLKWPGRNRVQITCNTSSAYHVQHVVLRATLYEGTAQLLNLTEFKSHFFSFILLAEPLTDKGVPGENPWRRASENATY